MDGVECYQCGEEIDPYDEPVYWTVDLVDGHVRYLCQECEGSKPVWG